MKNVLKRFCGTDAAVSKLKWSLRSKLRGKKSAWYTQPSRRAASHQRCAVPLLMPILFPIALAAIIGFSFTACNNGSGGGDGGGFHIEIEMVQVAGGTMVMGNSNTTVTLSNFSIGKYEVTQEQYQAVMGTNPSSFQGSDNPPAAGEVPAKRPVENVNWYDALVFCNKLSMMEDLTPAYSISGSTNPAQWGAVPTDVEFPNKANWDAAVCNWNASGYRLPAEAQWEYAARGGQASQGYTYPGSNTAGDVAWYNGNSNRTHQVGKKLPNELGLYDMGGNVMEWCWDWFVNNTYPSGAVDPTGVSSGSDRVRRGGWWDYEMSAARSADRWGNEPYWRYFYIGFRVVRPGNGGGKSTGAAVAAPTLNTKTHNSITVNAVTAPTNGQGVEYGINTSNTAPATWQNGTSFAGLTANTTYYIFARSKENETHYAGTASAGLQVTTNTDSVSATYIINGSGTIFTATKNSVTVGTANQSISDVIEAIRTDANGANCTIQFGNGTTALDIGAVSADFSGSWGSITLSGKVTSSAANTISISGGFSVNSTADITSTNSTGKAINTNDSTGILTISGGTLSVTGAGCSVIHCTYGNTRTINIAGGTLTATGTNTNSIVYVVYMSGGSSLNISNGTLSSTYTVIDNENEGTVTISGGTIESSSPNTEAIDNRGTLSISGGTVRATGNGGHAIRNWATGILNITGGTVEATGTSNYALYNGTPSITATITITGGTVRATSGYTVMNNPSGTVTLGKNPDISGTIHLAQDSTYGTFSVITAGADTFNPGAKVYTLGGYSSLSLGDVVVTNGASFLSNFTLTPPLVGNAYYLEAGTGGIANDLVLRRY